MDIHYIKNGEIIAETIIDIFTSVGWNKEQDNICEAFKNSFYVIAYDGEKMIGFIRALSDGYYYTGIYDVIVRPDYQNLGIGKRLVEIIIEEFTGTYFFLSSVEGKKSFYEKCGFEEDNRGMWIPRNRA